MLHVLDFEGNIIDFISKNDKSLIDVKHERNIKDYTEILDITILASRAVKFKERNRVIFLDSRNEPREFIINRIEQDSTSKYSLIECNASYLEDIATAVPYPPQKFEKYTTTQALSDVLKDTGWKVSGDTEYNGTRTTSWTSYQSRFDVLKQLTTTYKMVIDFHIDLDSRKVKSRYVSLKEPKPLFKGKEIVRGKDLLGLKRTVDVSEVRTALVCLGPEKENGERIKLIVKDDEAQKQFGLPTRYIWDIYEPESEDENMTERRLRTLGNTQLNKVKSAAVSYEVTSLDIKKAYPHEIIRLGDKVRVKDREFTPALYVEGEVISETYNPLTNVSVYSFGNYVEYKEADLRVEFTKKMEAIAQKLNDNFTNVNTIVADVVEGKLEYFERKIFKGSEPPENPVNDMLWLDTRNPDVAVLRRYWEGQWVNATAEKAEDIGAITREKALYSELNNTFVNLSIQHSKLLNEMHEVINSEYLVDFDLKNELNAKLDATVSIYNNIKSNLESMTDKTATIGKLIDTQTLFLNYRTAMQRLYNVVERAKIAIDERFKLLQSQYTEKKFRDALQEIADAFGLQVNDKNQLVGEPNVVEKAVIAAREDTKEQLRDYVKSIDYQSNQKGLIERMESADAERKTLAGQISDKVTLNEYHSGLEEQRQYTDNQLSDIANNPEIKASIEQANREAQEALRSYVDAQDNLNKTELQAYADGKISEEEQRAIQDAQAKLEEAKQNAELKARNAERKANAYTDDKVKESFDNFRKTVTRYGSQILQNGKEIKLRTTKEEFDATNKTLSNIMSEIVQNVTTGATIRFDDNGTAQSLNVGPQGIQLNGDKINLNTSREFNLLVSNMDNKVDKDAVVSSINATPEKVDINTRNVGIRGGSGQAYVDIRNDQIELGGGFRRTWRGRSTRHNIFTRLKDGHLRFRNNALDRSLYMSEFGISTYIDGEGEGLGSSGTIQWWDTTYSESDANGITINSYGGVVALSSDNNRIVLDAYASSNVESKTAAVYIHPHKETRPGNNRFAFTVSNADHSSNTDGYIMYGSDTNYNYGAGLRFSKSQNGKTVQVVDGNYSTGGDTTIEAGYGSFNTISKRDGNKYVRIISDDGFLVGRDNAGNRIASKFIYNRTYSGSPNLHITGEGTLGRSTSAMKYKALIEKQFDDSKRQLEHSQHILDLDVKSWFDKHEVENYAKEIVEGEKLDEDKYKISRHVGLIAEDLAEAGLIEHVVYGSDGEIEGIEYDRLWIHLLPVIKELKNRIKVLEEKQNESK
ncbi:phage tail spike protein [Staphylococcus schleiferi]|uniref:phage tail spike protein n=1 Tax=Staphylococcus schleiferi TaxID=1295 RepID=UPI0021CFAB59|nr:phage tail spike protein [Staphylococcus schleiferi]UXR56786.1 hypothetical protein MUA40_09230 [Staphylococcus schleiferi]UXR59070.1 hypothetical protein MUA91_09230 [Staphylococcus schleiferi]